MKTRQDIFKILSRHLPQLKNEYGVEKIGVFGSVIRAEQTAESDIDILVEFSRAIGMVKFLQLEDNLQNLLDTKVDLVTRLALKKHIGRQIMHEVEYVNYP
jgi:predicted nucleotidyltransferase